MKILVESKCILGTIEKILNDQDLMEIISYFLDLRCMRYCIMNYFVTEISNKLEKLGFGKKNPVQ